MDKRAQFKGLSIFPGVVAGPAFLLIKPDAESTPHRFTSVEEELDRLDRAINLARTQLEVILKIAGQQVGDEKAAIFEAQSLMLTDPELLEKVRLQVNDEKVSVEAAWQYAIEGFARQLELSKNYLFVTRASDIRDVGQRVLAILQGNAGIKYPLIQPSIVIARELTPTDTIQLDKQNVLGFCTITGGPTSHVAILARALGIPTIVGVDKSVLLLQPGSPAILDAEQGQLILNPAKDVYETTMKGQIAKAAQKTEPPVDVEAPAITRDGFRLEVSANVGSIEDAKLALELGAEGIGLLRTEFLYLDRKTAPTEDEQFRTYQSLFGIMDKKPIVVRTLDVGGDKPLPYLDLEKEANPFLGMRAIRLCLENPKLLETQLRALLRASAGVDLRIMFPMVATLKELRSLKELVSEVRQELGEAQLKRGTLQIGIMVEIPAVALLAEHFAKEVDFFSIGTNDLTQYTLAADRTNQKLSHLNDSCHPAVLKQIELVVRAAHNQGIWVGLCGEMASDPEAIPILIGLGLDEFSVSPYAIPATKRTIGQWSRIETQELAKVVMSLDSASAIREHILSFQRFGTLTK